jgi:hypothetical protein
MTRSIVLLLSLSFSIPCALAAQTPAATSDATEPAWKVDLEHRHEELIQRNGPGTDAALRDQLVAMADRDQSARGIEHGQPKNKEKLEMATNLAEVDAGLTAGLKDIVAKNGWPTIGLVGIEASNGAMLILTHTADHTWQLSLLPQLETLADDGKIDGSRLALVIDKELVSEGKLQRYGSQFRMMDGAMAMFGVEDPGTLDARRAKVFLPPMDVYKQMLSEMYHVKTTDKVVSATPPAQAPPAQ